MNIKQYFDFNFLKEKSNDTQFLQKLCNEDNGFIFKRLKHYEIFPDKEIIKNVNSHAAVIFLFENYSLNDLDYIRYSNFLQDNAPIMKLADNNISKKALIDILFNKDSGFTAPGFFLTKDDFVAHEDLIASVDLSEVKGNFSNLKRMYFSSSLYGDIHSFAEDFYKSSELHKKIEDSISENASNGSNFSVDGKFKL